MGTTIKVYLTLTGRFEPASATEKIGIKPDKTWRFDEAIQNTASRYRHDGWQLSTDETESLDLHEQLSIIEKRIRPYLQQIIDTCNVLKIDSELSCSVDVDDDQYPTLHFERETIKLISKLNADIDIDMY